MLAQNYPFHIGMSTWAFSTSTFGPELLLLYSGPWGSKPILDIPEHGLSTSYASLKEPFLASERAFGSETTPYRGL
jgi:hypothetical protein